MRDTVGAQGAGLNTRLQMSSVNALALTSNAGRPADAGEVREAAAHSDVSITSGYLHVAADDEDVGSLFG